MFPIKIKRKAEKVFKICLKKKIKLAFAESCTGGLLSSLITSLSNSSKIFSCGYVTYSNLSKERTLGISKKLLKKYGAVSAYIAVEMASSVRKKNYKEADIGLGITGIAGPGGATKNKKVGDVYIGLVYLKKNKLILDHEFLNLKGSRNHIRLNSVDRALDCLLRVL